MKIIKRLLSYLLKYKFRLLIVVVCILFSSLAGVLGSLFLQTLIDDYITPLISAQGSEIAGLFGRLLKAIAVMGTIYLSGIISTFAYNLIMVYVSQDVLKIIRDEIGKVFADILSQCGVFERTENGKKQLKCTKCGHVLISVPILPTGSETSTTSDAP